MSIGCLVKVRRLADNAKIPAYAKTGDACADLSAILKHEIPPGGYATIPTGIALELPDGYRARVLSRSGLASSLGIEVGAGVIDQGYRGEIRVVLHNHGEATFQITPGDRIAQLAIEAFSQAAFQEVEELSASERGESGFGSSGVGDGDKIRSYVTQHDMSREEAALVVADSLMGALGFQRVDQTPAETGCGQRSPEACRTCPDLNCEDNASDAAPLAFPAQRGILPEQTSENWRRRMCMAILGDYDQDTSWTGLLKAATKMRAWIRHARSVMAEAPEV